MMNKKGFTLIELIVTMMIMGFVLALTGPVYTRLLTGVKEETVSSQVYHDLINSLELIRLDIEHTGFGIARDETILPIAWNEGTQTLELRSTLNNTNQTTMGWALLNCATAGAGITNGTYIVNQKETPNLLSMVLRDKDNYFAGLATPANFNCPAAFPAGPGPGIYSAYPFDSSVANGCGGASNGGTSSWCTRIRYLPSAPYGAPASRAACAQGTFDLLRWVGNGVTGDPIVNCVADFRVRFDVDSDGTGSLTAGEIELTALPALPPDPATTNPTHPQAPAGPLVDAVKNMEFLLLVQAGQRDDDLNTNPNTTVAGVTAATDTVLSAAGVTNANNYRWKVLKISGKPMSW